MTNPAMPNLPGFGAITETMDMVRKMWGGMSPGSMNAPGLGIPGMVMPSLSVDEINKQIADLKAVESWLTLNMNMLRGTIQALEVQSATITTLRTMGESLSASVKPNAAAAKAGGYSYPFSAAASAADTARPAPPAAAPAPRSPRIPEPTVAENEVEDDDDIDMPPDPDMPAAPEVPVQKGSPKPRAKTAAAPAEEPVFSAPLANPAAWWNLLQDQFKQAVGNAMAGEPVSPVKKSRAAGASAPARADGAAAARKTTTKGSGKAAAPAKKPSVKSAVKRPAKKATKPVARRTVKSGAA